MTQWLLKLMAVLPRAKKMQTSCSSIFVDQHPQKVCSDKLDCDKVSTNYDSLVDTVAEMLDRWSDLPMSLMGRINLIKMSILPKFIYLFQALPLTLPSDFHKKLDNIFSQFIWNNRKARVRLKLLHLPDERGRLQVPSLKWYYWAAHLSSAVFYFSSSILPAWVNTEEKSASELSIKQYLYSSDIKTLEKKAKKKPFKKTQYQYGIKFINILVKQ